MSLVQNRKHDSNSFQQISKQKETTNTSDLATIALTSSLNDGSAEHGPSYSMLPTTSGNVVEAPLMAGVEDHFHRVTQVTLSSTGLNSKTLAESWEAVTKLMPVLHILSRTTPA